MIDVDSNECQIPKGRVKIKNSYASCHFDAKGWVYEVVDAMDFNCGYQLMPLRKSKKDSANTGLTLGHRGWGRVKR